MGIFGNDAQSQVDLDDLKARVAKLEAAVAALQTAATQVASGSVPYGGGQLAPQPAVGQGAEPDWMAEVRALKAQGKLINAIKVYRERTGLGLKEAKDAVEAMP
jgi:large subunit ribosomal protein L7/L12